MLEEDSHIFGGAGFFSGEDDNDVDGRQFCQDFSQNDRPNISLGDSVTISNFGILIAYFQGQHLGALPDFIDKVKPKTQRWLTASSLVGRQAIFDIEYD